MNNSRIIAACFVAVFAICSCVRETSVDGVTPSEITLTAYQEQKTKTTLVEQTEVYWKPSDEIKVFSAGESAKFISQNAEDAAIADFKGSISVVSGSNEGSGSEASIYALYPYREDASFADGTIITSLPAVQTAVAGTFADDLFISIGRSNSLSVSFYNVCSGIRFTVEGEGIKAVELKGNGNENIAGSLEISFGEDGKPDAASGIDSSKTSIRLNAPGEGTFTPGEQYFIVSRPQYFEYGITLSFIKEGLKAERVISTPVHLKRSIFGNLDNADRGCEYKENVDRFLDDVVPPDNEIWYITDSGLCGLRSDAFNTPIISHTYENGLGRIKCSEAITRLNTGVLSGNSFVRLYLPDSIEEIGEYALSGLGNISRLYIPKNLRTVGFWALLSTDSKSRTREYYGHHVSDDGRCVIIEGTLYSFAPYGLEEYVLPEGIKTIESGVFNYSLLKSITLPEGLYRICNNSFLKCSNLEHINIPNSVKEVDPGAFEGCYNILEFGGNSSIVSQDHKCLLRNNCVVAFAGKDITDYIIPEGIIGICRFGLESGVSLKSLTLPSSIKDIDGAAAFYGCDKLEYLYGPYVSSDNKCFIRNGAIRASVPIMPENYVTPEDVTVIYPDVFTGNKYLKTLVFSDSVQYIAGTPFCNCPNLESVVFSANLEAFGIELTNEDHEVLRNGASGFYISGCPKLKSCYFRSYIPPRTRYIRGTGVYDPYKIPKYTVKPSNLEIFVPQQTLQVYINFPEWSHLASHFVGHIYSDNGQEPSYLSSDYSQYGQVTLMKKASIGNGIDFVFMGDGYSDRQIKNGKYRRDIDKAVNAIFSEEPYQSFKDCFNLYCVNVVSVTEGIQDVTSRPELGTWQIDTYCEGNYRWILGFAKEAVRSSFDDLLWNSNVLVCVLMNNNSYGGTCMMFPPYNISTSVNYGVGLSIAYIAMDGDETRFNGTVSHEIGHGFAKLADEYDSETFGATGADQSLTPYGWWKNVDFTSDPATVKWSQFISDDRYASEEIGCYEGALYRTTGVWRPTENSIMRSNTGGFNAPSRYAIWYRIGKLAYGESWEGSYEDFVAYDAVNRTPKAKARKAAQIHQAKLKKPLPPLPAPVVVGHSWREELQKN